MKKKGSGTYSGIKPQHETWTDIRERVGHDSAEWRLLKLRELMGDSARLPDNYLSADYPATPLKEERELRQQLNFLWKPFVAQCERAVLDGDAGWFERQARALNLLKQPGHARFVSAVIRALEQAAWQARAQPIQDAPNPKPSSAT